MPTGKPANEFAFNAIPKDKVWEVQAATFMSFFLESLFCSKTL